MILFKTWSSSRQLKFKSIQMSKELEGMLSLPRHSQYVFAPVRSHHHYPWASLDLFEPFPIAVVPTQTATTISDYNVAIVHYLEGSWLMV